MRFLLDQNLSPALVTLLDEAGHDTVHVRDRGLSRAPDERVMAEAKGDGRVLISSDTDFGELLSRTNADAPSVLLLRRQSGRRATEIADLILANLEAVVDDLVTGAIVVISDTRIRVRPLPLDPLRDSGPAGRRLGDL